MKKKIYIGAFIFLIIDFISKFLVLKLNHQIEVLPNFFYIDVMQNEGAAFSLFIGYNFIFICIAIVVLIYLNRILTKEQISKLQMYAYMLLIGGILGNLVDRIFYGKVTDFLKFIIFNYNYPVFNVADICICLGVFLLLYDVVRGEINEYRSKRKKYKD